MQLGVRTYFPIDNVRLVRTLLQQNRLVRGAIIALDVTIDTVTSPKIRRFVDAMVPHVASGRIQLCVLSSMQKLYQCGLDRLSGGFAAWFTPHKIKQSTQIPTLISTAYCLLLHVKNADALAAYIDLVHHNNRYLLEYIEKQCPSLVTTVPPDSTVVSIDFIHAPIDEPFDFAVKIVRCLPQQFIDIRASWGFRLTVITIVGDKIRVSIGADVTHQEIESLVDCYCHHMWSRPTRRLMQ